MAKVESISIIIPNYNGVHLFPDTMPTVIAAAKQASVPFEIIIVDDRSSDGSIEFIEQHYPMVRVIRNEVNLGFSPTMNRGIMASVSSHVLLLNSDVKLPPDFFRNLLRYFHRDDTFGVMSRIIGWDNDKIQDGGKYPRFQGAKIKTSGNYVPSEPKPDQWFFTMYLSGANAFVDAAKLRLLNGFDEMFAPFYVEDYEMSMRAWRLGWKCYYAHESFCRHQESITIKTAAKKKKINRIYNRNKMFLHALHLQGSMRLLWNLQAFGEALLKLVLLKTYYMQAFGDYLKNIKKVRAGRERLLNIASKQNKQLLDLKTVAQVVNDELNKVGIVIIK